MTTIKRMLAAAMLAALATVGGPAQAAVPESKDPIILTIHDWTGQYITTHVMGRVLEEMGYNVKYQQADYIAQFAGLEAGDLHVAMEIWETTGKQAMEASLETGKTMDLGETGMVAIEEWWYPLYMKEKCPGLPATDDTMRDFVEGMGSWIMRGPLDEREVTNYSGIATTVASAGGSYEEAVGYMLEAMLQSPRFIYRVEYQIGDGSAMPVNSYELASRISYTIWGAPPDAELMKAAENGDLFDAEFLRGQAERMLNDPRAVARSAEFVTEWLNLNRLTSLQPNAERFPHWESGLGADMREETLAFFKKLVWEERRPLAELLNAQFTYLTPRLARHYGLELKEAGGPVTKQGPVWYDLGAVPSRGGLLTQGSILTIGGDDASMVTRGLFVLHDLLRGTVKDPPPGLDTTPVPSEPGISQRHISEDRIKNVACGGCHSRFEPLAFGLEKFDGLGSFRENDEYGNQMREDGEILIPGAAEPVRYHTSAELMDLLAQSPRVGETITWKLVQFAMGRPLVPEDIPAVKRIHDAAEKAGGTYAAVMTELAMSELLQLTRTEPGE